ncbi:metal-dependent hydrolase, endonuclease/exonuclease/phosphatase family [Lentimicrobium saccharophilum]|uniref:Metal-dependent hydrolase, endonuclease/exonuclease/phosphatase family n=1 Tax=Lentimicrobium saccharophilum TaxID=1678841 RepID=A0A0S7C2T6_9BACT|nr:endonuclease/exonuclease/phosphatase family protein [Lentimicrobium saccharophilum]GAP44478.1 metal-dependent hydrolase, endonuclease/exonuclease/phosphatase family [Lentimicrobium saccharophilum]
MSVTLKLPITRMLFFLLFLLAGIMFPISLPAQQPGQIKVMSWNIRLDTPADGQNQWKFRKSGVCDLIMGESPDLLGVQEAMHNQMKDLRNGLKGYKSIGVARDDGKRAGEYSAVFYKKSRFRSLHSGTFWLSETPDQPGSRGWDAACNRVVTWSVFRDKKTGRKFLMMNTHFDHVGDTARIESAALIIRKSASLAGKLPVILTGDFNVTDKHRAYRILTWADNENVFTDTRKKAGAEITGPDYTFIGFSDQTGAKDQIDFIFATYEFRVLRHQISDFRKWTFYLSDHLPVTAILGLTE